MAEAFARKLGLEAYSCGSKPSRQLNPIVLEAMREKGIDISLQIPQGIGAVPRAEINLTVVGETIAGVAGVAGVHDLHVWSLTSGVNALSAHVIQANGTAHRDILTGVHKRVTSDFRIAHVTVQVEPEGWERKETHL